MFSFLDRFSMDKKKGTFEFRLPKDNLSRSLIGFFVALVIGAIIPKTASFLVRRILLPSAREIFVLAFAGWLTDELSHMVTGGRNRQVEGKTSKRQPVHSN